MSSFSVNGVNSLADVASTTTTGTTSLGEDTFLRLLTTQLQNQDPSNPVSNEEFVAQLAQFSQLEELQGISTGLESLYLVNSSMNNASMTNLLGRNVVARSDTFHYGGSGEQEIHYDASAAATTATLTVTDADGHVVWSGETGALTEGEGSYTWDGKDSSGALVEAGDYTFTVTATDVNGEAVEVIQLVEGIIDQMSFEDGSARPTIDGVPIDLGDIVRLSTADAA
ncbi:MAG: flagellar hook capping FlgD N-terminal domain-containing protein [Pseudomonadota bacterium]|nr:flagellar hook capping FlgD N-terminal domain-containing protein [Pseudomonadota bacterium]